MSATEETPLGADFEIVDLLQALHYIEPIRDYRPTINPPQGAANDKHLHLANGLATMLIRSHGKGDVAAVSFRLKKDSVSLFYGKNKPCNTQETEYVEELADYISSFATDRIKKKDLPLEALKGESSHYHASYILSLCMVFCQEKIIHRARKLVKAIEQYTATHKEEAWYKPDSQLEATLMQDLKLQRQNGATSLMEEIEMSFRIIASTNKNDEVKSYYKGLAVADYLVYTRDGDGESQIDDIVDDETIKRRLTKLAEYRATSRMLVEIAENPAYSRLLTKIKLVECSKEAVDIDIPADPLATINNVAEVFGLPATRHQVLKRFYAQAGPPYKGRQTRKTIRCNTHAELAVAVTILDDLKEEDSQTADRVKEEISQGLDHSGLKKRDNEDLQEETDSPSTKRMRYEFSSKMRHRNVEIERSKTGLVSQGTLNVHQGGKQSSGETMKTASSNSPKARSGKDKLPTHKPMPSNVRPVFELRVSKATCWSCYHWLQYFYHAPSGPKFLISGSHNKIYPGWNQPDHTVANQVFKSRIVDEILTAISRMHSKLGSESPVNLGDASNPALSTTQLALVASGEMDDLFETFDKAAKASRLAKDARAKAVGNS